MGGNKILITGAGGFIGSHLVEECVREGLSVRAFLHYNSRSSWGWLDAIDVQDDIEIITGDIRDFDSVQNAMNGCSGVFHLAALIGIPYSYMSPLAYLKTNVLGTYNILQASRINNVENVLITSTSETYGTAKYVPIDEAHPLVGQSPYSASKISAEQLALSYHRSFNTPIKIVKPFNTYGPRQSARAIIPSIIVQILNGQTHIKLGSLKPTRDLTYVKDTVKGFYEIYNNYTLIGSATNIGSGKEISVGDLAIKIANLMGVEIQITKDNQRIRPEKSEVERLLCNNSKLKKVTKWVPQYSLTNGLKETIQWIKDNMELYKQNKYNV